MSTDLELVRIAKRLEERGETELVATIQEIAAKAPPKFKRARSTAKAAGMSIRQLVNKISPEEYDPPKRKGDKMHVVFTPSYGGPATHHMVPMKHYNIQHKSVKDVEKYLGKFKIKSPSGYKSPYQD